MTEQAPFDAACLGVAGPVRRGRAPMMNYPWVIDQIELEQITRSPVRLINDFHAQSLAILHLEESDIERLDDIPDGEPDAIVVLGPGTGFGEAFLTRTKAGWHVVAGEGSHGRFAPQSERHVELWRHLTTRWPEHVSVERIVSGPGIENVYDFVTQGLPVDPRIGHTHRAANITELALSGACAHCVETIEIFVDVFADEAATMVLKCNADQVYLGGGIPPRILPFIRERFRKTFENKGRYRQMQEKVSIRVVLHDDRAVGWHALELIQSQTTDSPPRRRSPAPSSRPSGY